MREAGRILREEKLPDLEYLGFVEGDDIGRGKVDVVVTEGFAGNIALKTAEGTARQIGEYLQGGDEPLAQCADRLSVRALGVSRSCASAWIRAAPMAASFSASTASSSKATAATDAEGFAAAIELGHGVVRDELLAKITAALGAARAGEPQQAVGGAAS